MGSLREPAGVPDHWHDDSQHPLGRAALRCCDPAGFAAVRLGLGAPVQMLAQFVERTGPALRRSLDRDRPAKQKKGLAVGP